LILLTVVRFWFADTLRVGTVVSERADGYYNIAGADGNGYMIHRSVVVERVHIKA
jgi:hypothetical protein